MTHQRLLILTVLMVVAPGCRKKASVCPPQEVLELSPFFDVRPSDTPVSYLYAPGFQNTEVAMGRLCPNFTAVTGEKIRWRKCAHVVDEPHSAVIFPEIDLRKPSYFTLNPITILVNSVRRDLAPLAQRFMQDLLDFDVEDNPDSVMSVVNYGFNFSKANLAQAGDIKALYKTYNSHVEKYPGRDIILYGDSRGAATIFNFIAIEKPTPVRAAVLEGIFDSLPHVVKHILYSDKTEQQEKRLYNLMRLFLGSYNKRGVTPRKCVESIADNVPLLMVISEKDGVVPLQSTFYLYNTMRTRGHKKVHLLILKKSHHPGYMIEDEEDKKAYQATVHAFYKQYNLPHNSALAQLGADAFAATQPTAEFLKQTYELPVCPLCN